LHFFQNGITANGTKLIVSPGEVGQVPDLPK
jgi:hypothetical protein